VLELFRVYPDRINKPTLFMGFHGGAIFDKAIKWQGLQYIPLAIESEGFDVLGDGKMARPKIRVANKNNIITNLLQNNKDLTHAKIVRKKVQVKFLDDDNFDGGNPFGVADSKAELLSEEWIMGRKTQESKILVEFELNSPLDLENFSVNARGIQARFCYWQYRGEGCRYQGLPIEQADGTPFRDTNDNLIVPNYTAPTDPNGVQAESDFWSDVSVTWNINREYSHGDIAVIESPTIFLPASVVTTTNPDEPVGATVNSRGVPLKTVYVSVADSNSGKHPENNPSYWQKDGCTKKMNACQRRFNPLGNLVFRQGRTSATFPSVRFSGVADGAEGRHGYTKNKGLFHTTDPNVTGALDPRKAWTLIGWANINENSPRGAGIFSTSPGEGDAWPASRFININRNSRWGQRDTERGKAIQAQYVGYYIDEPDFQGVKKTDFKARPLGTVQAAQQENEEWNQYIVWHSTGTMDFIENAARPVGQRENPEDFTTLLEILVNGEDIVSPRGAWWRTAGGFGSLTYHGNFASWTDRVAGFESVVTPGTYYSCLPQTFMIGAQEFWRFTESWPNPTANPPVLNQPAAQIATMNGHIGMWGLWNRALNKEELAFLKKPVIAPFDTTSYFDFVPRRYEECTGIMSTLTGGTGDGLPAGAPPLLYGSGTLVAWWDGTTGNIGSPSHPTGVLLDIHTGNLHLTGSGDYLGVDKTYNIDSSFSLIPNPTSPDLRFGGFPGTDGFGYERMR